MFRTMRFAFAPALAALTLTLSACSQGSDPSAAESQAARPEIEITHARVVLPPVSGNPGAAYFELTNNTAKPVVLTGVSVAQATRTEMHETMGTSMVQLPTVTIEPGAQTVFAPGGRHVMVFGAPPSSAVGETRNMTFLFEDGRREKVDAMVEAGGGGDAMGGMDHSGAMN
jgi:periplasmic copper chaperone A